MFGPMLKISGVICLVLLFQSALAVAANSSTVSTDGTETQCKTWNSHFHINGRFGANLVGYTGENKVARDFAKTLSDSAHVNLGFSLGLGLDVGESATTLLGLLLDSSSDHWAANQNFVFINQSLLALDVIHFFGGSFGRGFLLRADAGPAMFVTDIGNTTQRTTQSTSTSSTLGVGAAAGFGYAIRTSDIASIMLNADASFKTAGASTARTLLFSLGLLF
jgi:hypothetical protein